MILDFSEKMAELTIDGKKPWCDGANAMHWDGQYTQFSNRAKEDVFFLITYKNEGEKQ